MKIHALRVHPGEDLRHILVKYVKEHQLSSAWIQTGMGSLSVLSVRFAGQEQAVQIKKDWEICSLSGTLCPTGVHLHIVASDEAGNCIGGHLGCGSLVRTTAEIVLGSSELLFFQRELDEKTGYPELVILRK